MAWFMASLAAVIAAPAGAATPGWDGVWQGTIGPLPVRACLEAPPEGSGYSHGSYYYLSRKRAISLSHEDDGSWSESAGSKETGRWTVAARGTDALAGEWRSGTRRLPIALKRVAYRSDDDACGSEAYLAPRLGPVTIVRKPAVGTGFSYTQLVYDVGPGFDDVTIESFAYPATRPGDSAIVAGLAFDPLKRDGDADFGSCYRNALGSLGSDGEFIATRAPAVINADFLVVQENYGGFCGGAHPDYGYLWKVWDRRDGQPVHLATWLSDGAFAERPDKDAGDVWSISPALRKIAIRHLSVTEDECKGVFDDVDFWNLGLAADGFVLTPSLPHVIAACGDDAVVPFAEFAPFLTSAGRAQVARFRSSPAVVVRTGG